MDYDSEYADVYDEDDEQDYAPGSQQTQGQEQGDMEPMSASELLNHCALPVLWDSLTRLIIPLLAANLLLMFLQHLTGRRSVVINHILTIVVGAVLIALHFGRDLLLMAVFGISVVQSVVIYAITSKSSMSVVWIWVGTMIGINESLHYFPLYGSRTTEMRMPVMILTMKLVSYCHDAATLESKDKKQTKSSWLDLAAYILHPSSSLAGTWHPVYPKFAPSFKQWAQNFGSCLLKLLEGTVYLLVSTCVIQFIVIEWIWIPLEDAILLVIPVDLYMAVPYRLLKAYTAAVSFHFSHYFICTTSEALFYLWGHKQQVCRPLSIELPRSLVDVVSCWNIPMSQWLKKFVFKPMTVKHGSLAAIMVTYLVSSFLHGLSPQIWLVLLSLGMLTYVEHSVRRKLSAIYSACIESKSCVVKSCTKHRFGSGNWIIKLANWFFSLVAIFHLAYLGAPFDGQEESNTVIQVLRTWAALSYYSHIILVITFVLYYLI